MPEKQKEIVIKKKSVWKKIVVIVILVLLAICAFLMFALGGAREKARSALTVSVVRDIETVLSDYYKDNGKYPDKLEHDWLNNIEYRDSLEISLENNDEIYFTSNKSFRRKTKNKNCPNQFRYIQTDGGNDFMLLFCLSQSSGWFPEGLNVMTKDGVQ